MTYSPSLPLPRHPRPPPAYTLERERQRGAQPAPLGRFLFAPLSQPSIMYYTPSQVVPLVMPFPKLSLEPL